MFQKHSQENIHVFVIDISITCYLYSEMIDKELSFEIRDVERNGAGERQIL